MRTAKLRRKDIRNFNFAELSWQQISRAVL